MSMFVVVFAVGLTTTSVAQIWVTKVCANGLPNLIFLKKSTS